MLSTMFRLTLLATSLLVCAAASSAAQTAEETVLLIAAGVEAGATAMNKAGEPLQRYEKISEDPLVLRGVRLQNSPGFSDTLVRVERSTACKYAIITTWEQNWQGERHVFRGETSIDLTDAAPIAFVRPHPDPRPRGPRSSIEFPGARIAAKIMRDEVVVPSPPHLVFYSTQERLDEAVAHMRKTFCPGRAE